GTSNDKLSLSWMSSGVITCDESGVYFRDCDTWNTSCIKDSTGGNAIR
ncbi:hypothetical protein A2U01_0105450, partial [Trifolium medium]|nr:hypothetical protein [Trifolium medium]